ncbi:MAG: FAD-dependent oxidoreductase [Cyclobacteriaceae bacterium]
MKQVKYLIIGQGIAGTLLSWEFKKRGIRHLVIDQVGKDTSSFKAAGIFNPITGRKMVKTWMADELFSGLGDYYEGLEKFIGQKIIYHKNIYRPFNSMDEQNDWQGKMSDGIYSKIIKSVHNSSLGIPGLLDSNGGLLIDRSGYVDLPTLIESYREILISSDIFVDEVFEGNEMTVEQGMVNYKDISAEKVIFCEGVGATKNRYWQHLPFKPVKGEIIELEANFQTDLIVNRNVFLVPRGSSFIAGSTYDHSQLDNEPSESGIRNIKERLIKIVDIKYKLISSWAGVRPATFDRRPFIGLHDKFPELGIFNGFGTKGVSLVPFFAIEFVNFLLGNQRLTPEVDIDRVLRK